MSNSISNSILSALSQNPTPESPENQGGLEAENPTPVSPPTGLTYQELPSGAVEQEYTSLECQLFSRKTEPRVGRRHVYVYDVIYDGETIVTGSPDPDCDLARALLARGITGKVILGGRTFIDIEKAAKLRTSESTDRRSRFVPYVRP